MFGLTRLVGLSSEMQPVCPCMLCKKDEVLSAQAIRWGLSTTLFDRLRRQKHVPMLLDVQLLASRQRES